MPPERFELPFLTRKMLNWEHGADFDLEVSLISNNTEDVFLTGMTREGAFTFRITPAATNAEETFIFNVPDIPISITLHTGSSVYELGDLWCTAFLRVNQTRVARLFSGYVTIQKPLTWPQTESDSETGGLLPVARNVFSDPTNGTNLDEAVTTNKLWLIQSIRIRLVTDANAADRRMHLKITGQVGALRLEAFPSIEQVASTTIDYIFAPFGFIADETDNNVTLVNIPKDIIVNETDDIETDVVNIQAGDSIEDATVFAQVFNQL